MREKILEVAEAHFARRGFSGVGLREVADAVGLGKSSLFHHFRSKVDLYLSVLGHVLARIDERVQPVQAAPLAPFEKLDRWIDALVDVLAEQPGTARLLLRGLFEDDAIPPEAVRRVGPVAREAMPDLYREHDVFLFPSIWGEPFSIGLLESMASSLAVVGTATGGSSEILRDGENSLVFAAGDERALADRLRVVRGWELRSRLGEAARRTVEAGFRFENVQDHIESFLTRAAGRQGG